MSPKLAANYNPAFLARMLLGGALLGGSAGMITSLLRQHSAIKDDERENEDDDVLKLDLPQPKMASDGAGGALMTAGTDLATLLSRGVNSAATGVSNLFSKQPDAAAVENANNQPLSALDYVGGGALFPLGLLGGLHVTRGMYQKWRNQEVREKLQREEQQYMKALQAESQTKRAGDDARRAPSLPDWLLMAMGGLPVITGLASGYLTDRILDQQFATHAPKPERNFNIQVPAQTPEDEEQHKKAQDVLVHAALQFQKEASDAGIQHVVAAVAGGMLNDLEDTQFKYGSEAMLDLAAGANLMMPEDQLEKCAAVRVAVRSGIGPALLVMSAAAFSQAAPDMRKSAQVLKHTPKLLGSVIKFAAAVMDLHVAAIAGEQTIKEASTMSAPAGGESQALRQVVAPNREARDNTSTLQAAATGSQFSSPQAQADRPITPNSDTVDELLTKV